MGGTRNQYLRNGDHFRKFQAETYLLEGMWQLDAQAHDAKSWLAFGFGKFTEIERKVDFSDGFGGKFCPGPLPKCRSRPGVSIFDLGFAKYWFPNPENPDIGSRTPTIQIFQGSAAWGGALRMNKLPISRTTRLLCYCLYMLVYCVRC